MKESTVPPDAHSSWKESEKILARRIAQTRRQIRFVDCFSIIAALATIGGGLLFLGILADHLLFAHGLSRQGRLYYFGGFLTALFLYLIYRLYPLLRYRINPLYAADVLEKSNPSLKNGLINWLLLKNRRQNLDIHHKNEPQNSLENSLLATEERFLQELAVKTASQIEAPSDEAVVDFSPAIRWGIAFAVLFAIFCGYTVFSAKNPFISTGRLLLPLAAIDAPQSVRFLEITPGNASYYQGKQIAVTAEISGTKGQPVYFRYSTADGRILHQNLEMTSPRQNRFEILFPQNPEGLLESLNYQIVVGNNERTESRSPQFHLDITPAMAVAVRQIIAHYPDYIPLPPIEFKNQGDFRALEGSQIEIFAESNVPVSSALFVPNSKVIQGIPFEISADKPTQGSVSFPLKRRLNAETEEIAPEFANYQILITDRDGLQNIEHPEDPQNGANRYRIEIFEDTPPTIRWEEIPQNAIEIPLDEEFSTSLLAADSDFGLDCVRIDFQFKEKQGENQDLSSASRKREISPLVLFSAKKDSQPTASRELRFEGAISPKTLSLSPGDEIEFKGVALDGHHPKANQSETESLTFIVLPPKNPNAPDISDEGEKDESAEGESGEGEKESSDSGQDNSENSENQNSGQGEQDGEGGGSGDDSSQGDQSDSQQGEGESSDAQDKNSPHQDNSSEQPADNQPNESDSGRSESEGSKSDGTESGSDADNPDSSNQEDGGQPENGETSSENSSASDGQSQSPQNQSPNEVSQEGNPDQGTPQNEEKQTGTEGNSDGGKPSSDSENSPGEKSGEKNSASDSAEGEPQESKRPSPPIDPETNPGDAFEAILKQMEEDGAASSSNQPSGVATGPTDPDRPKKATDREIDSDALQGGEGSLPDGKRQQGSALDEIPSGTPRENGDVDPQSQNYMAVDSPETDPNQTESVSPDANVTQDPDHPAGGTAASPEESQGRDAHAQNPANDGSQGEIGSPDNGDLDSSPSSPNKNSSPIPPLSPTPSESSSDSGNAEDQSVDLPINSIPPQTDGSPSGEPGENSPPTDESPSNDSDSPESDKDGPSAGYRGQGGAAAGTLLDDEEAALADSPHLRYTQKATALALEYLEDQIQKGPNQALLDRLGWSEEELKAFWDHWNEMKKNASDLPDSDAARKDYLDALRDLGLRDPQEDSLSLHRRGDNYRTHSQSREKRKSPPPRAFQDRFRLYNEGISRQK